MLCYGLNYFFKDCSGILWAEWFCECQKGLKYIGGEFMVV